MHTLLDHIFHRFQFNIQSVGGFALECGDPQLVLAGMAVGQKREGKTIMGVIEGAAVPKVFIPQMIEYYRQGRFPVDRIMKFYDFDDINQAYEDSHSGKCIKTVVRMKK